jgi:hypothetical protein
MLAVVSSKKIAGSPSSAELRYSEACVDRERKQCAVASSFPAVVRCRVDQRTGLGGGEECHSPALEAFGGDAEQACDDGGMLGVT